MPSGGLHFTALSSRFVTARSSEAGSPVTHHGWVSTSMVSPAPATARAYDGALDDLGEIHLLDDGGQRLVAGQLHEVADQCRHLLDLSADVVEQLGPQGRIEAAGLVGLEQQVEVGAQRRDRRTQLVPGVGDELALAVA